MTLLTLAQGAWAPRLRPCNLRPFGVLTEMNSITQSYIASASAMMVLAASRRMEGRGHGRLVGGPGVW